VNVRVATAAALALTSTTLWRCKLSWAQPSPAAPSAAVSSDNSPSDIAPSANDKVGPASPSPRENTKGISAPILLQDAPIDYPEGHREEVDVTLILGIAASGDLFSVEALGDATPFTALAIAGVKKFTFQPARRYSKEQPEGEPIAARVRFVVSFRPPKPNQETQSSAGQSNRKQPAETDAIASTPTSAPNTTPSPNAPQTPKNEGPEEVRVRGNRGEPARTATLTRAEVRQIPGTFGDPFRAVEIMPGVTPIVSGLPFFFIRGAPPGNVGYFLDNIRVPYLFHVGAGPSVVHPGLMDRVDLYSGGYPPRFGRFSGGIVSGETLAIQPELRGEYNLRLFDAGALVETPFAKDKGNVLLGGRYGYPGLILSLFSPTTILDYWDYQARASYKLTDRDTVSVFIFGAYDYLAEKTPTEPIVLFGTEFHRVDARYDHAFGASAADGGMRTSVTVGIDRTRLPSDRFVRTRSLQARTLGEVPLASFARVRFGSDALLERYDIELNQNDLNNANARILSAFPTRTDLSLGAHAELALNLGPKIEVSPGLRTDLYVSQGTSALSFEPRLSARTQIHPLVQIRSSFGLAQQPPSFVIPVPGFQPGGLRGGLQRAFQQSLGVEVEVPRIGTASITGFTNHFFQMSDALSAVEPPANGCPPGAFPSDTLAGDPGRQPEGNGSNCRPRFASGRLGSDRSGGGGQGAESQNDARNARVFEARANGQAYGMELLLKRKLTDRIGGFVSYTLSRSTRQVDNRVFIASFDRTHVLNAALAIDLGRNWRAGARGTFYTGLPKANITALSGGGTSAASPTGSGTSANAAEQSQTSSDTRLDPYFKLDLRVEKRWQLSRKVWISVVAEWVNVTLNKESVGTQCTLNGCTEQKIGPVTIPSLGLEGGF
jgi:TonB-dependent Receptor Plug Domain